MSDVQEQILDAVKILADNAVSASNATITIECKIIEVIDAGVGLYKVEYKAYIKLNIKLINLSAIHLILLLFIR